MTYKLLSVFYAISLAATLFYANYAMQWKYAEGFHDASLAALQRYH